VPYGDSGNLCPPNQIGTYQMHLTPACVYVQLSVINGTIILVILSCDHCL
jgi:hypothetical protein